MISRRERVLAALNFEETDRLPKDLGGMLSTGISCFAYPHLVKALGLPPRLPRLHDQSQMLALPDTDVLDALDCDVVTVLGTTTNAFPQPGRWKEYDFNGRLRAKVHDPDDFQVLEDGTIYQSRWNIRMPPEACVFNEDHAGQSLDFMDFEELPLKDLEQLKEDLKKQLPDSKEIKQLKAIFAQIRKYTDRAVFYTGPGTAEIGISAHGGIGVFPLICKFHPDYVADYHEIMTRHTLEKMERVLPEIRDGLDIFMQAGDDWGTQNHTITSPEVFRTLFLPYYRRMNEAAHQLAPEAKTFLHSCGAIYDIIDDIVEGGFDVLNPVQWTAGGHSFAEWKEKCHGRIALWGGGINTQVTLPFGSIDDVNEEVSEICEVLGEGGGYVFNAIHNLLANVDPHKIIAMYETAGAVRRRRTSIQVTYRKATHEEAN